MASDVVEDRAAEAREEEKDRDPAVAAGRDPDRCERYTGVASWNAQHTSAWRG